LIPGQKRIQRGEECTARIRGSQEKEVAKPILFLFNKSRERVGRLRNYWNQWGGYRKSAPSGGERRKEKDKTKRLGKGGTAQVQYKFHRRWIVTIGPTLNAAKNNR